MSLTMGIFLLIGTWLVVAAAMLWGVLRIARRHGLLPRRRIADADGRRDRLRLSHRSALDDGRRARGLEAPHARQAGGMARVGVLAVALPIGRDVACVADGKAVRLTQGEAGSETDYGSPLEAAQTWIDAGAEWIHLVDLDAAFGRGDNRAIIREVVNASTSVKIELSGGIRDDASLEAALEAGATRVNLGTAALENPEWTERVIAKFGDAIAVGLDVRGTTLAARGWTREGGDLWEVLARLEGAGCPRYVVTDVTKDGTLKGPNVELLREVMQRTSKPVVASGGISSLQDIRDLHALVADGLEGAILGKSLYANKFTLQEALAIASVRV